MLDHNTQQAAWRGHSCPSTLPKEERIPYQMLCLFYRHYREGILPRDTAQVFKTLVCDWEQVPNMEKAALLRYLPAPVLWGGSLIPAKRKTPACLLARRAV